MKFAYVDPPYFGRAKEHYGDHPESSAFNAQETHLDLIDRLVDEFPDGWALCMNPRDLAWQLPRCPDDVRVAAWVKSWHQLRPTPVQFAWEPVVFRSEKTPRPSKPMVRDWICGPRSRCRGVIGAKPDYFNRWVLDLLGFHADEDELVDLFPGSEGMMKTVAQGVLL